jgi:hypothetical protein
MATISERSAGNGKFPSVPNGMEPNPEILHFSLDGWKVLQSFPVWILVGNLRPVAAIESEPLNTQSCSEVDLNVKEVIGYAQPSRIGLHYQFIVIRAPLN